MFKSHIFFILTSTWSEKVTQAPHLSQKQQKIDKSNIKIVSHWPNPFMFYTMNGPSHKKGEELITHTCSLFNVPHTNQNFFVFIFDKVFSDRKMTQSKKFVESKKLQKKREIFLRIFLEEQNAKRTKLNIYM